MPLPYKEAQYGDIISLKSNKKGIEYNQLRYIEFLYRGGAWICLLTLKCLDFLQKNFIFHVYFQKLYPSSPPSPEKNLLNMFDTCLKKNLPHKYHSCHLTIKYFMAPPPCFEGKNTYVIVISSNFIILSFGDSVRAHRLLEETFSKVQEALKYGLFQGGVAPQIFGENFTN